MSLEKCTYLNEGRTRKVYLTPSKKYVIKVPIDSNGEIANHMEAGSYEVCKENRARCRLCNLFGLEVLVMELVKPVSAKDMELPDWTNYVDCQQVGLTKRGQLVAYDWARI